MSGEHAHHWVLAPGAAVASCACGATKAFNLAPQRATIVPPPNPPFARVQSDAHLVRSARILRRRWA